MTFLLSGGKSQLASGGESSSDHCRDALQSSATQPQLNQFFLFFKIAKNGFNHLGEASLQSSSTLLGWHFFEL